MTCRRVFKLPFGDVIAKGAPTGLLSNGFGGYFCIDASLSYQGWYQLVKNWQLQKSIESITPIDEGETTSLYHQLYGLRREFASGATDTIVPYQKVLLYSASKCSGRVRLTLDGRESYEGSSLGREYTIKQLDEYRLLIHFTKKNEEGVIENEHYVCMKGFSNIELLQNWREVEYSFDVARNAAGTYWVFDALTFIPKQHTVISFGLSESEAITLADIAFVHYDDILSNVHASTFEKLDEPLAIESARVHGASTLATHSLYGLLNRFGEGLSQYEGVYAGLPWFFQIWSRDELISLGGLLSLAKKKTDDGLLHTIKSILARHLRNILDTGMLPNRHPHSELGSIDALGWLSRRMIDFITILKDRKQLFTFFSLSELLAWKHQLEFALEKSKAHSRDDVLFTNEFCETWMDTAYHDDGRSGIRIEIQALFLCVYDAILLIDKVAGATTDDLLAKERDRFVKQVREKLVDKNSPSRILDGLNAEAKPDKSVRPNLFLAYYLAKSLFSDADWKVAIPYHIEKLFLPWGGISTLPSDHPLFQPTYTGENNMSYHRGDSWYFVNNFTALVLHRLNKEAFASEIKKIIDASAKDILELGLAGHGSEISSAHTITGEACLAQAWSVASFVELMHELYSEE